MLCAYMESDGKLRILRILELLRGETDEQNPISTAEIERILKERVPGVTRVVPAEEVAE